MGKTTKKDSTRTARATRTKSTTTDKAAAAKPARTASRKKAPTAADIVQDILAREAAERSKSEAAEAPANAAAKASPKASGKASAKGSAKVAVKASGASTASKAAKGKRPSRTKSAEPDARDINHKAAIAAARYALEKKATGVRVLDLTGITSMTDFFVIASGDSDRQVKAIGENVITEMRDTLGISPWRSEGWDALQWVLIDFVDFVVHVFQTEARQYYNLERLWADAPSEEIADEATRPSTGRKKKETVTIEPETLDSNEDSSDENGATSPSGVRVISDFKEVRAKDR